MDIDLHSDFGKERKKIEWLLTRKYSFGVEELKKLNIENDQYENRKHLIVWSETSDNKSPLFTYDSVICSLLQEPERVIIEKRDDLHEISTTNIAAAYTAGFLDGLRAIKSYRITADVLFRSDFKNYLDYFSFMYNIIQIDMGEVQFEGCSFVKKFKPTTYNPPVIYDLGYNTALTEAIEELENEAKKIGKGFLNAKALKKEVEPLDFNMNQTDLIHFFDVLSDADIIKEPDQDVHKTKGGFYGKIESYFTARGKPLNASSMKSIKTNKQNRGTSYSENFQEALKALRDTIDRKLSS